MLAPTSYRVKLALVAIVLFASLPGCADLSAVRDFAKTSYQAANYTQLVDSYVQWPSRQKPYVLPAGHKDLDDKTTIRQGQRAGLLARHAAVQAYMESLGKLASDEAVVFDSQFDKLGTAVSEGSFASQEEVTAASTIAKVLTKAATDAWRKGKVKELIEEANPPLQKILTAMNDQILTKGFLGDLEDEETVNIAHFYQRLMVQSNDVAAQQALKEWRDSHVAQVKEARRAVTTYSQTVQMIAQGHQTLYDKRNQLSEKEVMVQIKTYKDQLETLIKALKHFTAS